LTDGGVDIATTQKEPGNLASGGVGEPSGPCGVRGKGSEDNVEIGLVGAVGGEGCV
jgi:hypothetical protein